MPIEILLQIELNSLLLKPRFIHRNLKLSIGVILNYWIDISIIFKVNI